MSCDKISDQVDRLFSLVPREDWASLPPFLIAYWAIDILKGEKTEEEFVCLLPNLTR